MTNITHDEKDYYYKHFGCGFVYRLQQFYKSATAGGKGNIIGVILSVIIFGVMKKGLGTLYGFADSTVNLAVGLVLIVASLLPNVMEDISNRIRVKKQHVTIKE